jgi:hypothetical protein
MSKSDPVFMEQASTDLNLSIMDGAGVFVESLYSYTFKWTELDRNALCLELYFCNCLLKLVSKLASDRLQKIMTLLLGHKRNISYYLLYSLFRTFKL